MAVKRVTPINQIMQYMDDQMSAFDRALIRNLAYCGEECVKQARDYSAQSNPYTDRTGNLRSSIGYIIVKDGEVLGGSDFQSVKGRKRGSSVGMNTAHRVAAKFPRGIVLIIVAGMKYAASVEARGKDVLTSSEILANRLVPQMLEKLGINKK